MEVFEALAAALKAGESVALITVIKAQGSTPQKAGRHMLVFPGGRIVGTIGGGTIEHKAMEVAQEALVTGKAQLYRAHLTQDLGMCCGGTMEVFIEPMTQAPNLVLFGAGHVCEALAPMASAAGFRVTVVDEREDFATEARFPSAAQVVCDLPTEALDDLPLGPGSYALIFTHSHRLDEELLKALVDQPFAYLGMIGSKAKVIRFIKRLSARGVSAEALARVHMPIGIQIGAVTPGEIAVSALAELIRVRRLGDSGPEHGAMSIAQGAGAIASAEP